MDSMQRFWSAFGRHDPGRCWSGERAEAEEEEPGSALLEWELRGPARFAAERERALRQGGSRLAAKVPLPYGDAGICGRAAYTLQLLAALFSLAEQVEAAARERGWEVTVGVLAYRDLDGESEDEDESELVTELDSEQLADCDTLVFWIEVELPKGEDAAFRLGDQLGRLMAGAGAWLERLDAGDREALRSAARLPG